MSPPWSSFTPLRHVWPSLTKTASGTWGTCGAGLSAREQVAPGGVGRISPCTLLVWKLLSPGLWAVSVGAEGVWLKNLPRDVPPPGVAHTLPGLQLATLPRVFQRPEHGYVWAGTGASGTEMGPFLCSEQRPVHRGSSGSHSDRTCEGPARVQGQQVREGKVSVTRHHVNS